jgi:type IV pilus assembly protein PilB
VAPCRTRSRGNTLQIAIADPGNVHAIDELRLATATSSSSGVASREDIENEIRRLARASEAFGAAMDAEDSMLAPRSRRRPTTSRSTTASPTSRSSGSSTRSSSRPPGRGQRHPFEPQEDSLVVRFASTVCCTSAAHPEADEAGVTTRLKVLAKLDIAERRKPQDGRISLNAAAAAGMMDDPRRDLPTVEGEAVVMRLSTSRRRRRR